jgi:hypothetical protein
MTGVDIDDDAVWQVAIRNDRFLVRAVRIHGVNAAAVELKNKETRNDGVGFNAPTALT